LYAAVFFVSVTIPFAFQYAIDRDALTQNNFVLYGCEILPLTLRKQHEFGEYEYKLIRKVFLGVL
jgi:hypothetical protein